MDGASGDMCDRESDAEREDSYAIVAIFARFSDGGFVVKIRGCGELEIECLVLRLRCKHTKVDSGVTPSQSPL